MRSITSQERIIMNNFRKKAFTLAEVLITLGIIGVVAALTMPSLIAHHRKVATASKLKKFYSTMEQAIRFGEAEYGDSNEWVKPDTQEDENGNGRVSKEFFMTYLAPYFKYTDVVQGKQAVDEDGNDKSLILKFILLMEQLLSLTMAFVWILLLIQMATSYLINMAEINLLSLCVLNKNTGIVNVVVQQKLFVLQNMMQEQGKILLQNVSNNHIGVPVC